MDKNEELRNNWNNSLDFIFLERDGSDLKASNTNTVHRKRGREYINIKWGCEKYKN